MKRTLLSLIFIISSLAASAMSYEEARQQAWFLTDKMAYELNLTTEQYDRAYQINLDYLMSVNSPSDCTGYYWQYRNTDLRCILFDWQYNLYRTLDYFLRPVRWYQSRWYYPVFDHYRYGYYFFDRPNVYVSYTGGMWRRRSHNDPSPYLAMAPHGRGLGMRDQYRNRNWFAGNDRPNNHPHPHNPQPNGRVNQWQPHNQGGNSGFRPSWSNASSNNGNRGDNNRNNNRNGGNNTPPYRDAYTNYRQTGNSSPTSGRNPGSTSGGNVNRGGASGVSGSSSTSGSRSTRGTSGNATPSTGRTFGQ